MQYLLGNAHVHTSMGTRVGDMTILINQFSTAQVNYYGAKFAASVKSSQHPINHITVDADGTLHGWIVTHQKIKIQRPHRENLQEFAKSMKEIMKISIYEMRTMKDPTITHLN